MAETLLQIDRLSKNFRSHWTFRSMPTVLDVSLSVTRGEAFGFLGHNGAGKTTTIKCILGLIKCTSGRILLEGKSLEATEQRRSLGYLPEQPYFYDHLTVEETLDFYASLHGMIKTERRKAVSDTLEKVELGDRRKSCVRALSKGLQQRLGLAQAIVNDPKLLLLDEPFSGLDPLGRKTFREILLALKAEGTTIFMSSHILSDVEEICSRVAIMAQGRLRTVFELKDAPRLFGEVFEMKLIRLAQDSLLYAELISRAAQSTLEQETSGPVEKFLFDSADAAQGALKLALDAGVGVHSFQAHGRNLEDIFVSITNEAKEESTRGTRHEAENAVEGRL